MLQFALGFFILALVAFFFGATGIAGLSMEIGRTLLIIFLAMAIISGLIGLFKGRTSKKLP